MSVATPMAVVFAGSKDSFSKRQVSCANRGSTWLAAWTKKASQTSFSGSAALRRAIIAPALAGVCK